MSSSDHLETRAKQSSARSDAGRTATGTRNLVSRPDRVDLSPGLNVPRILTGLWQVADLERGGTPIDQQLASDVLINYADAGFDGFDMADHYGSAELIAALARQKLLDRDGQTTARFFTKWCPQVHQHTAEDVRAGVQERLDRLGTDCIDLLQLHWWTFEHPGWVDVMDMLMKLKSDGLIGSIGLTNVGADHLHMMVSAGYEIDTNQVSFSVIDRRARVELSKVCVESGVKLLAYGTLAGGFISQRWLNAAEPQEIADWSKMKYKRFIDTAGGWKVFQELLHVLSDLAERHSVSIANIATRWVLDHEAVGCVIVGARLGENQHRDDNLSLFSFKLSADDHDALDAVFDKMTPVPGDCGDEYRKPPYLTASGDLSHHVTSLPSVYDPVEIQPGRWRISSGSVWEDLCGFSRATRTGARILVSGTTATHGEDREICAGDVRGQTVFALDKIIAAVRALGGKPEDITCTRIYMRDSSRWEEASRVHGRYFSDIRPVNTLLEVSNLVGEYEIEIEAEAEVLE